jgi:hypothetical protein
LENILNPTRDLNPEPQDIICRYALKVTAFRSLALYPIEPAGQKEDAVHKILFNKLHPNIPKEKNLIVSIKINLKLHITYLKILLAQPTYPVGYFNILLFL